MAKKLSKRQIKGVEGWLEIPDCGICPFDFTKSGGLICRHYFELVKAEKHYFYRSAVCDMNNHCPCILYTKTHVYFVGRRILKDQKKFLKEK
jgi:hypothetical protein